MASDRRPRIGGCTRRQDRGPLRSVRGCAAAAAALLATVALPTGELRGQGVWTGPGSGGTVWLEIVKPEDTETGTPLLSTAWYLGGRLPLGETTALVGELPMAFAGEQEARGLRGRRTFTLDAEAALGNPYLGLELATGSPLSWELGLWLPAADGGFRAIGVGRSADAVDRLEAWTPADVVPLVGTADYVARAPSGLFARARGGSTVWIPTGVGDMEVTFQYGGQVGWENEDLRAFGGLTGRFVATGSGTLADITLHQLGGGARFLLGRVEPGVQLRVPLDDGLADLVFGVSAAVRVP